MAKQIVEELVGVLGLDVDQQSFREGDQALEKTGVSFTHVAAMAAAAASAVQAAISGMVFSFAESADASGKFASRIGVTVEGLTSLRHAVEQTSSATGQQFNTGLQRMTRRIAEANAGSKELSKVFNELGLDVAKLAAMSPEDQFLAISDAMNTLGTDGEQVRATFKIFDTEGVELINTMRKGSDEIRRLQEEAKALGIVLSDEDAKAAAEFNDQLDIAQKSLGGVKNEIGRNLLPIFTKLALQFSEFVKDNKELIQSGLLRFFDGFAIAMKVAAAATGLFVAYKLGAVVLGISKAMKGATLATALFNAQALLIPIAIGLGIAALALIAQDFATYIKHGEDADTITGRLINRFGVIGKAVKGLSYVFKELGTFIGESIGWAVVETEKLANNMGKIFGANTLGAEAQSGETVFRNSDFAIPSVPPNLSQADSFANTSAIPSVTNVSIDAKGMSAPEVKNLIDVYSGQQNADSLKANSTGKAY